MPTHTHTCISITCDGCSETASLYEDMGVAHYDSIEQAHKQLIDDVADEPEFAWSIDGDQWFCPSCTAETVCKDAGGHDWGSWDVYGAHAFRACRRGHCQRSERRPVETTGNP